MYEFGSIYFKYPTGLTVYNGKLYISDHDKNYNIIAVFLTNGKFLCTIGSGQLGSPRDVAVYGNNKLLIVDYYHDCIHTFTLDGDCVGKFGMYVWKW